MNLFPNPYARLDHKGQLAGAVSEFDARPGGMMPHRRLVGAELVSSNERMIDRGYHAQIKADYTHKFGIEPVEIASDDHLVAGHYLKLIRDGELFDATAGIPLDRLAAARAKVIAAWKANYGTEPPGMGVWGEQFALDDKVAAAGKPAPITPPKSESKKYEKEQV